MPLPGHRWFHIVLNTHRSWLPGDPRGFRNRGHRLHSSGDYKQPPPTDEHAGLHRHNAPNVPAVTILATHRPTVGEAIRLKLEAQGHTALTISVGAMHAHLLVQLPDDRTTVKKIVAAWKQASSHATRATHPGRLWCRDCDPVPIRDHAHQRRVFNYIRRHAAEGAWVWSFNDAG